MRLIGLAVVLSLTLAPLTGEAEQAGKVYRIGWLSPGSRAGRRSPLRGHRADGRVRG